MSRQTLIFALLVLAIPALAQSELEGSPIHPSPLRIVPAPSLKPATPAASADHAPAPANTHAAPGKPRKKRQP